MADNQKSERKVRQQFFAVGMPLVTIGSSLQILAGNVHAFIPQMIVRAGAILMCLVGIVVFLRGMTKPKKAELGKDLSRPLLTHRETMRLSIID